LKLAIFQRICPGYRIELFQKLTKEMGDNFCLFIGDDIPGTKVKNAKDLSGINYVRLKTRFVKLPNRKLPLHTNLISEARKFKPDVILCEGESHFLGYLQAFYYRKFYNKNVALMHWCFISLPGDPIFKKNFREFIKGFTRKQFDAFVLYSSFSKECLLTIGQPEEKMFVATNVGPIDKFLKLSAETLETKAEARQKIGLNNPFTVLYLGTLDPNKRPELVLDLAADSELKDVNFVLLGTGPMLEPLRKRAADEQLSNVFFPGRIEKELPLYLRASDTLMLPGRGGIVISEAMAFGVPVLIHQGDGTEYDLVKGFETGFILDNGLANSFREKILFLKNNPEKHLELSNNCINYMEQKFTTDNEVKTIVQATEFAFKSKNQKIIYCH
jgi:glycosyltransferase involved in cell wall biosynthesis